MLPVMSEVWHVYEKWREKMAHGASPWSLVSKSGQTYPLPQTMVFLGRDDKCDIVIESRSVNPHHAILNYDSKENKFRIKDLGSINGTYINESRIPEEEFFTLDDKDTVRFGYDPTVYHMAQTQESTHHVEPPDTAAKSPSLTETQNAWTSREDSGQLTHGMAECPGCIAEQELQHTCGIHDEVTTNHNSHCISSGNRTNAVPRPSSQTNHLPPLTPCQHRRSKWRETAYHVEEFPQTYIRGQDCDYFYDDPEQFTGYDAVSTTEGSVNILPHAYVYNTVPDNSSHIVHNSGAPVQGAVCPTVLVRHVYHPGAPPQFVSGPAGLPVNYISAYHDPYLVSHGSRVHKGMSSQPEDPTATNFVPDDTVTLQSVSCDTNDFTSINSAQCSSQPVTTQLMVAGSHQPLLTAEANSSADALHVVVTSSVTSVTERACNTDSSVQTDQPKAAVEEVKHLPTAVTSTAAIETQETLDGVRETPTHKQSEQQSHQETQTDLGHFTCDDEPIRDGSIVKESGHLVKSASFTSTSFTAADTPESPPLHRQDKRRSISSGHDTGLETVKKGTPLYGQPSWWGEVDADQYKYPHTSTLTEKDKLNSADSKNVDHPVTLNMDRDTCNMSSNEEQQPSGATYMEIPHDSGSKQSSSHDETHTPPERDIGPSVMDTSPLNKSNTAFTVEFGDEDEEVKAATKNRPIGEFLPSGLRRSFRQREEKIKEMQEKKKEESAAREHLSSQEMSPARQRKTYNWQSTGSSRVTRKNSLSPQRSGYHSDGHNSNLSSDNEDISIRSESFTGRAKRIKQTGRSVSVTEKRVSTFSSSRSGTKSARVVTDKRKSGSGESRRTPTSSSRRTPTSQESRRTPTSSESHRVEKHGKAEHRKTPTGEKKKKSTASVAGSSDSAYLINKMFTSQGSLPDVECDSTDYEYSDSSRLHETHHNSSVLKPRVSKGEPLLTGHRTLKVTQKDDDVGSETGTYTIQGEKDQKEIENARKSIDKVFGVVDHQEYMLEVQHRVINFGPESPADPDYSPTDDIPRLPLDSQDLDGMDDECEGIDEDSEQHDKSTTTTSTEWLHHVIKQGKSVTSSSTTEYSDHSSPLHKPVKHVRPGTGRKLPSPPVHRSQSDEAALDGSCVETDVSGGRHRATVKFDSGNGGTFLISFDAPQREATSTVPDNTQEDQLTASQPSSDRTAMDQIMTENSQLHLSQTQKKKIVIIQKDSPTLPVSKEELLIPIKDTDSDTDSSTCAVIGSRYSPKVKKDLPSREKPKFGRSKSTGPTAKAPGASPRAKSMERRPATAPRDKSSERKPPTKSREVSQRLISGSKTKRSSGVRSRTSSTNKDLNTSDGPSESESASIISSSTDYSETSPRMIRKASAGKGTVLLTRTNRTAVLRRQKLEMESESYRSDSSTLTPRSSRPNSTGFDSPKASPRASSRSRSSSRSRPLSAQDSSRGIKTDQGSGQRVTEKGRESQRMTSKDSTSKYSRSVSCKSTLSSPRSKSETKETRPRSGRSITSTAGLVISGNRSQPSSRSNSPRTQEYNAWKRRKSYDPRQAVAEAKATKKVSRSKPAISDQDKSAHSVSSLSSEDSSNVDDSCGESSRTDDIIKLSTEIYKNLAAMSRENDSEEVDILMTSYGEYENELVCRNLSNVHPIPQSLSPLSNGQFSDKTHTLRNSSSYDENADENLSHEYEQEVLDVRNLEKGKSYNTIILRSVFEISNRVRHKTDALMDKLKRSHDLHNVRGCENIELDGDSPGLQELAGILSNLRTTERHLHVIDRALFPRPKAKDAIHDSKHLKELERIRSELADFKPVEKPTRTWGRKMHKQTSHDSDRSEPFNGDDYCDPIHIQDA